MSKGYVYVVDDGSGAVKIGVSKHKPGKRRVRQLQTGNPRPIVVRAFRHVEHYREIEREVHRRLGHNRSVGEWFAVSPAQAVAVLDAVITERRRPTQHRTRLWKPQVFAVSFFVLIVGLGWYGWSTENIVPVIGFVSVLVWLVLFRYHREKRS